MILFRVRLTPKNYTKLKAYTRDRKPGDPYWTDQDIVNEALDHWFKRQARLFGYRRPDKDILADAHAINASLAERGKPKKPKR
jgi:hypothetical protein